MLICLIVGARPNFMKIAPIDREFARRGIETVLVHTGQHYDENMSKVFFDDLGMPKPDIYLGVGSASHAKQTAQIMVDFEEICEKNKPSMVVVAGDVNSTIACALVSSKLNIPVAHVEAGLRSFDMEMPEEINRVLTDRISNLLFTPSNDANQNLINEGASKNSIKLVGNIMIDSLLNNIDKAKKSNIHEKLNIKKQKYAIVTLHRPSNVDYEDILSGIITSFEKIGNDIPIIFPIHPRTSQMISKYGFDERINKIPNLKIINPQGYLDFLALIKYSKVVLTDSGGLQEETTALGIPCITIRKNTERPETIHLGMNIIANYSVKKINAAIKKFSKKKIIWKNPYGVNVSEKILKILIKDFAKNDK